MMLPVFLLFNCSHPLQQSSSSITVEGARIGGGSMGLLASISGDRISFRSLSTVVMALAFQLSQQRQQHQDSASRNGSNGPSLPTLSHRFPPLLIAVTAPLRLIFRISLRCSFNSGNSTILV